MTATKTPPVVISKEVAQSKPYLTGEFNLNGAPAAKLPQQQKAREALINLPFPGNKDEPWRKTNISKLPIEDLILASAVSVELSDAPEKVTFLKLSEAPVELAEKLNQLIPVDADKFAALASGYVQDGFILIVPKGLHVNETLEATITVPQDGTIQNSQIFVLVEEGASATLHLTYAGSDGSRTTMHNGIVEVIVKDNAHFHLVERQELGSKTWHFSHEKASVAADAVLDWVYFAFGTQLTKSFIDLSLDGKGSDARLYGLAISNSGQHLDLDTQQDHMAPITFSDLTFKTALLGTAQSVWQGMIYVDPKATQTDGYQSNRNLLLDKRAHADSIPGLEIKTDDVRCSHGATITEIDQEQIFYLKARGLDEATARQLIVNGFFQDIIDRVRDDDLRVELIESIHEQLAAE
ncbi:MAG: Fe-S cluster assembly protein SufD [Anaerolineae bacterium]|nr:Fe-S cluster assembly protein SufD [Anaerolineae bacterium]